MKSWTIPVEVFERLSKRVGEIVADWNARGLKLDNRGELTQDERQLINAMVCDSFTAEAPWDPPKFQAGYDAVKKALDLRFYDPHTGEEVRLEIEDRNPSPFQAPIPVLVAARVDNALRELGSESPKRTKYAGQPDHASAGWRPDDDK